MGTTSRPHLEWTITGFNALRQRAGYPLIDVSGSTPWEFNILAFAGSFDDAGIGEDLLPAGGIQNVFFPCTNFDACDVCGGDGSTCVDCLNQPFGTATYDVCGVCNGDGSGCRDCLGVPNGDATYDVCDICNGNGESCIDCLGMPFGSATYDECDVCEGDNSSCLDCEGTRFGTAEYDECDV